MSPDEAIAALDDALSIAGEDVVLRRVVGSGNNTQNIDVACRAIITNYRNKEEDVASAIAHGIDLFILSPSEIARAQWPGGELPNATVVHPSHPRRGDKLIVQGRVREIESCTPKPLGSTIVRFNGQLT